jgi:hypothetical protein
LNKNGTEIYATRLELRFSSAHLESSRTVRTRVCIIVLETKQNKRGESEKAARLVGRETKTVVVGKRKFAFFVKSLQLAHSRTQQEPSALISGIEFGSSGWTAV